MANIRKRNKKYQVRVKRKGASPLYRTFHHKKDAEAWARHTEVLIDRRDLSPHTHLLDKMTVMDVIDRYLEEKTVLKKSGDNEAYLLKAFLDSVVKLLKMW